MNINQIKVGDHYLWRFISHSQYSDLIDPHHDWEKIVEVIKVRGYHLVVAPVWTKHTGWLPIDEACNSAFSTVNTCLFPVSEALLERL